MSSRAERVRALRRERPRSGFLRYSLEVLAALVIWAWLGGHVRPSELLAGQRLDNLRRFVTRDALPWPLREEGAGPSALLGWASELMTSHGFEALWATLWISVVAIALAGAFAALTAPLGARRLLAPDPWVEPPTGGERPGAAARLVLGAVRLVWVLMRAVPEYVWAFLLLAILGAGAWPAVLALAIHNGGILGRLTGDTVDNLEHGPLAALRGGGATRAQLVFAGVFPLTLPRFLLYFFYRFETCVREASVLGMLGVVSLGYYVQDARARMRYDELLFLVALGAVLVVAADLLSVVARRWVREAR